MHPRLILPALLLAASITSPAQTPTYGELTNGQPLHSLASPAAKAVVLFFVASDCPISNRTFPEMARVRTEFSSQNVRFWFVYPNAGETPQEVQSHQTAYDASGNAVLDTTGLLTRLTGAKATPEAVVLEPLHTGDALQWIPVYAGRVDNRYVRLGLERPQATEHFAEEVVREVLNHQPIQKPTGNLVGCAIMPRTPQTTASR